MVEQKLFRAVYHAEISLYLKFSDVRISVKLQNKILSQYHDTFTKIILLVHL
jgi:hypothetical protein